jgi:hypothetical protein
MTPIKQASASEAANKAPVSTPVDRVTVLYLDGNSIAAMAVSRSDDGYAVDAVEHLELDKLLEVVTRLRHPIFMDLNFCLLPEKELIQSQFSRFLEKAIFNRPMVMLLAPEKVQQFDLVGEVGAKAMEQRRTKLLRQQLPINPYEYPSVISLKERPVAAGQRRTTLVRLRLADLVQISQIVKSLAGNFLGYCSPLEAAARVSGLLAEEDPTKPVLICDVGKLRTYYIRREAMGSVVCNPIPVGLARDDTHYFKSISPDPGKLQVLNQTLGTLLFPPEATPSPLFSGNTSSPQVDCTRLALQLSRYALRAFSEDGTPGCAQAVRYLTGRGSRVPELREYMQKKTGDEFRRIDRRPIHGIDLAPNIRWGDVADNFLMLGAGIEALEAVTPGARLIDDHYRPLNLKRRFRSIGELELDASYVLEQRIE